MYYAQSYLCSSHSLSLITMSVTDEKIVPEVEDGELVLEHPNNICNWSDDIKQWPSIVYGDIYTYLGLVTFIIVTMPFHNTQYIMGYNIMAQPHGLTMSL